MEQDRQFTPIVNHIADLDALAGFNHDIIRTSFERIRKEITVTKAQDTPTVMAEVEAFVDFIQYVKTSRKFITIASIDDVNNIMNDIISAGMVSIVLDVTFDYLLHASDKVVDETISRIATIISLMGGTQLTPGNGDDTAPKEELIRLLKKELWLIPLYLVRQVEF